jgi:hypothetical protein
MAFVVILLFVALFDGKGMGVRSGASAPLPEQGSR